MRKFMTKCAALALSTTMLIQGAVANSINVFASGNTSVPDHLIINQVYGGNGKGDTPISNSFIELYNPTAESVKLDGYTLSFDDTKTLTLSNVTLESGKSWLVVGKAETTSDDYLTYDLPEADQTWDIAINNKQYTLTMKDKDGNVVDAATVDGSNAALKISKQKSLRRIDYIDTDDPSDWKLIVWEKTEVTVDETYVESYAPRNSAGSFGTVHVATTEPAEPEQPSYTPVVASDAKITGFNNGSAALDMELMARYNSGAMNADGGSMEIVEYNSKNGYSYSVSGLKGKIIASKISNLPASDKVEELPSIEYDVKTMVEGAGALAEEAGASDNFIYGDITSVAISPDGTKLAAAVQHADYNKPGKIAVFDCYPEGWLTIRKLYDAGVQPDMVTFADDNTVLTADEGEPREGYGAGTVDPAGTVTILKLNDSSSEPVHVGFAKYNDQVQDLIKKNILIGKTDGQTLTPETDLEPEYIAVSSDGKKAYVSLQEANAIAVLDIEKKEFTGIYSVGFEDYSQIAVDIDKTDRNYDPKTYENLVGARMPDGIAIYENDGKTYLLTANEGDSRDWEGYCNEVDADLVVIDASKYDGLPTDKTVLFGGRSFTAFEVTSNGLKEVFDSKNEFEQITAREIPDYFNCSNDKITKDNRSGKKGPEPENVTVGQVGDKTYAFIALERIGGVMAYDITNPEKATYANYINSRDFSGKIQGDVSPEGLCVADVDGKKILLAACEVSGTLAAYELTANETKPEENTTEDKTPATKPAGNGSAVTNTNTTASTNTPLAGQTYVAGNAKYKVTAANATSGTATYLGITGKKTAKMKVPATVKIGNTTCKVTAISANAMKNNKKLTTVVIGKNVKTIGKKAFYGCKNLKKVLIKSKVLKKVGAKAFTGTNKKLVIKVPAKKLTAYKKLLKNKGQANTAVIIK